MRELEYWTYSNYWNSSSVTTTEMVKLQSRSDKINESEYHHELHKIYIRKTQILMLKTGDQSLVGHKECTDYIESSVGDLLLHPTVID